LDAGFSIFEFGAVESAKADVQVAGDFPGQNLGVEGEEFEGLELWLEGGEEYFVDGCFYFFAGVFVFVLLAGVRFPEGEGGR